MNNFKIGDLVYTDLTGDVVQITKISRPGSAIFSGNVVKHLDGFFEISHSPIGFHTDNWWAPVFRIYTPTFINIKII